ncbi:CarD family transcriptional regulator [Candidatus Poriferisodalis sp.]|uniref:CarD family transcriptional regulator n=1 Tax=Candidatus Poriferisodalis sp. TaxID=3101277 RepID=UPI003B01F2B2
MKFKVGDRVIYPHHGAAEITSRERRNEFGKTCDYLVLKTLHGDMDLKVPAETAAAVGMRPPIDTDDVEDLFELLAKKDIREPANWSRRFKNHQEKLKSGDIYQVAEVVRNLALRENAKGLSAGEKSMLEKSRQILVSELSISMDVTEDEAQRQVELRLAD